ncbi:MAG: glycosyltransferase [Clostridiaceae bacterium]
MKRIMFLIESLAVGGAEKVLTDMANNLDKEKYDITVISIYNKSIYRDYQIQFQNIFEDHIRYKYLCDTSDERGFKMFNRLQNRLPSGVFHKMFIKEKYDIEIAFSEGMPAKIVSGAGNRGGTDKYAWLHTDTGNLVKSMSSREVRGLKKTYSKFDRIIAVSKSVANSFNREINPHRDIDVKYNPVDEKKIIALSTPGVQKMEKRLMNLIAVGRLTEVKGYDRLLKAAAKLRQDGLDFRLQIVGEGEQRWQLEKYIEENDLESFVQLLGFQKNPYKYMSQADLFVCSSRAEGFSTVVTEALILGLPVVTTDCAGMRELLGDNEFGIVADNNDEAIYLALKDMLEDRDKYQHYKKQALKRSSYFSMERSISELEKIF